MSTDNKALLESLGSRAIAALRAAIPDGDDADSVAFREALEMATGALVAGGVRGPVIDVAIRGAMDAYAGMPVDMLPVQQVLSGGRASITEQIREVKAEIAKGGSLEMITALQSDLDAAAVELGVAPKVSSALMQSGREVSGLFMASLGDPVRDANELVSALRKLIPDRDPEVTAFRSALESMTDRLYASGVGAAVIGPALGDALNVYVTITPNVHMKGIGQNALANAVAGYVLAFPGASDVEADELVESLRAGGNTVMRVDGDAAQIALNAALDAAGLNADELRPE